MININRLLNHTENIEKLTTLHIMCGIPGSGKSTFAKEKLKGEIVSLDGIREQKYGDASIQGDPKEIVQEAVSIMNKYLSSGIDVIYDATSLKKAYRNTAIEVAKRYNVKVILHWINTSLKDAKLRNRSRERVVDEFIIEKFYNGIEEPTIGEGIDTIIKYDKDFNVQEQILSARGFDENDRELIYI